MTVRRQWYCRVVDSVQQELGTRGKCQLDHRLRQRSGLVFVRTDLSTGGLSTRTALGPVFSVHRTARGGVETHAQLSGPQRVPARSRKDRENLTLKVKNVQEQHESNDSRGETRDSLASLSEEVGKAQQRGLPQGWEECLRFGPSAKRGNNCATHETGVQHATHNNTQRRTQGPSAFCFARARILDICGGPQSCSLTDRVMPFNECVPCWNGPSCRWLAVGSCLFTHGGEEGHPPRAGGTMETKVCTLRVDHLEQEILFSIRLMPRIDSGSLCEIHEDAQPHCEPDQSEPSDDATEREESWESCEEGWQAVEQPLTLQRVSSQMVQRERVTVEISESRPRPCRTAHRWVSKKWLTATWSWLERDWQQRCKTSLTRQCRKGWEMMTAWRSLAQGLVEHDTSESDEDWMEHLKKRYKYGTDDGQVDHRPAGPTRGRAGRRRPRSKNSLDEWSTSFLR